MEPDVLLLNANHQPLKIINYKRAVILYLEGKVYILEQYANMAIRSMSFVVPWPAVVVLKKFVKAKSKVRFRRHNVLARDDYTCQYCGATPQTTGGRPDMRALTMDHIVPRSRAIHNRVQLPWNGRMVPVTCWDNIVTCCVPCNTYKGSKTPKEAGMKLLSIPSKPTPWQILQIILTKSKTNVPEEWMDHVEIKE